MEYKEEGRTFSKEDVFSEVNGFAVVPSCPRPVLKEYENHFDSLWDAGHQIRIDL